MKIPEHPQTRLLVIVDRLEQHQRVALAGVLAVGQRRVDHPGGGAPEQQPLFLLQGHALDLGQGALFLGGDNPQDWVAGADVEIDRLFHHMEILTDLLLSDTLM